MDKGVSGMRKSYDFFSFFVIPALTLLLAAGHELTETNFSVIGNREGRRGLFLLWGAASGNYFYLYTKELLEFGDCEDGLLEACLSVSFVLFLCGVGLPYLPQKAPFLSKLHVWASFGGPVFLFLCLYRFLRLLEEKEGICLRMAKLFQLGTAGISAFLYLKIGIVSGLLELFVTFSTCMYLAGLQYKLEKIHLSNR